MDFLRRHVFRNFSLKLLSLASAVLLWSAVTLEPASEVAHIVPIEFQHVADDLVISSSTAPDAQVWIRGPQRVVRKVNPSDLHVTIDLGKLRNVLGEHTFDLAPSQVKAPYGVEVVQVVPAQVHLRLDPRTMEKITVPAGGLP
jgi:YbbR domain-containing protein